ncbi:D-allose transport system permease protein AlsC [Beauveria bassiana D1-5]|uniref:Ribulose-phosphate 3-epimerase n=1 Tax=Beauveria bassiana D1-5 TaxID=1245745 RepID=A0A0A2VT95_BEABA|nr:D-allose transport system permease protein AlsC [Beauveria bassiana D1-5]
MNQLRTEGTAMVYISHKLAEIRRICDRYTVMKDGSSVCSGLVSEVTNDDIVRLMVGRELQNRFSAMKDSAGNVEPDVVFEVKNVSSRDRKKVKDISFSVNRGEILGFSGLVGSGRTELMDCLFGVDKRSAGEILLNGKNISPSSPMDALKKGMGYITESRRDNGFFANFSIAQNIAVSQSLKRGGYKGAMGLFNEAEERQTAEDQRQLLALKCHSVDQNITELSGGNQQKVLISKWLCCNPEVIIFDEPTRGIDVGAKAEIYKVMRQLADDGKVILMVSSELPEIIAVCDRIARRGDHGMGITTRMKREESEKKPFNFAQFWDKYGTFFILAIIVAIFGTLSAEYFLTASNISAIFVQSSVTVLIGMGEFFAILVAGIDLSVGAILALSGMVTAKLMLAGVDPFLAALIGGVIVGGLLGAINGCLVNWTGLHPFIITLGTNAIFRGITLVISDANSVYGFSFDFVNFFAATPLGIPVPVIFSLIVAGILWFLTTRTRLGRNIYALGGNKNSAFYSGIDVKFHMLVVFIISGICAGLAGVVSTARLGAAEPLAGMGFETYAIASAIIGGTSFFGGKGRIFSVVIGGLIIGTINNGLNILQEQIEFIDLHADYFHIDIMDGHFVPNLTLSPFFVGQVRKLASKPLDCHLMVTRPQDYIVPLAEAGADIITLHPETINGQAFRLIEEIRRHGMKVGLILNPETPVEAMKYYIHKADKVTVMTVDPGFAGQPFIPEMLEKVAELKAWREREGLSYEIEIDGSCNAATYERLMAAGADVFIVGTSGLFNHARDIDEAWQVMSEQILAAKNEVMPHAKTA